VKDAYKTGAFVIKACDEPGAFAFWNAVLILELCPSLGLTAPTSNVKSYITTASNYELDGWGCLPD